jgi:hypothetical protein
MVTQMRKVIVLVIALLTSFPAYANLVHVRSETDRPTIERIFAGWQEEVPIYSQHPYVYSGTEIRVDDRQYNLLRDVPRNARIIRIEYDNRTMRIHRLYFTTREE